MEKSLRTGLDFADACIGRCGQMASLNAGRRQAKFFAICVTFFMREMSLAQNNFHGFFFPVTVEQIFSHIVHKFLSVTVEHKFSVIFFP